MSVNDKNMAVAISIISARYTPQYGVPLEEIVKFLLSEMDDFREGYEEDFASDFGKPYINGKLNSIAFEKWLDYYTKSSEMNSFDRIEDFLLDN
jgi:hypothetical protein